MESKAIETELRKTYAESVHRTNRFAASTLTILLILVVIVQQELLTAKSQARKLRRDVISATERLHRCAKSLAEQFPYLRTRIRELSSREMLVTELQIDEFPRLSGRAALTATDLKQIEAIQTRVAERLREEARPDKARRDTQLIMTLEELARLIKPYKKDYQDCLSLEQSALTKRKELQDMRAAKQAIPTPFGNFQVPPKLALMALAFAAVLTYLSFNASVMKLRALTRAYLALQEGNQTTPLDRSPPFWLYGRGSSDFPSLFSRQTGSMASLIASAALHAGWVIFAGWLVYESWTWKSSGTLLFRYKHLSDYLLVVLLAVAAVMALVQLVPRFSKESLSSLNPATVALRKGLNRRAFLAIAITGLIAGAAYYFGLRRTSERSNNCALKFDSTSLKGYEQDLVTNLRTRVLHHRVACQNHLPRPQNSLRYEASLSSVCLHASSTARILEQLAIGDALHHRHESAVAYLRQAIDMSPLSYHLYDRLIGLYGRLRQYDEIEKLLQQGLLRVQTMKEQTRALKKPASLQAQKRMQRAEEEFNLRYGTYNDRKQLSSKR